MKNIKNFFEEYGLASLQGKSQDVAKYYADTFMVATKTERATFANDQGFLKWLDDVFAFNKRSGMTDMQVVKVETSVIGHYHTNATVTWGVRFAKKPNKLIQFDVHYIINHFEDQNKIILYISDEGQQQLMEKEGVI